MIPKTADTFFLVLPSYCSDDTRKSPFHQLIVLQFIFILKLDLVK